MAHSIAALPMYDAPELRAATDDFWQALADYLRRAGFTDCPDHLTRSENLPALWSDPQLLFAQTCGYPLTHGSCGNAELVATPIYDVADADGPLYGSAILVRDDSPIRDLIDARGAIAAINGYDSNTGMNLFRISLARAGAHERFFSKVVVTGAHRASIESLLKGDADIASIDVVTLAHFKTSHQEDYDRLRIVAMTPKTPGLPYITSGLRDGAALIELRNAAIGFFDQEPRLPCLEILKLKGAVALPRSAYDVIISLEEEARALGYPELR